MGQAREKFATQVREDILKDFRQLAKKEGRQIQSLTEEAMKFLLENHAKKHDRLSVLEAYESSLERHHSLYEKLAK